MSTTPIANWLNKWALGQQIRSQDLAMIGEVVQDMAGFAISTLCGQATVNGALFPLTITKSGANVTMAPTAGSGTSPIWMCQGRLVVQMPAPIVQTPPGATLGRIDIFQAKPLEDLINPFSVLVEPGPVLTTEHQIGIDADIRYKQGVDSGSPTPPAPDSGYVTIATVTMPAAGGNPSAVALTIPIAPTLDANSGLVLNGAAGFYAGVGVPTFSAPSGSQYLRYDGSTGHRRYVNQSTASTSGTTWTAIAGE